MKLFQLYFCKNNEKNRENRNFRPEFIFIRMISGYFLQQVKQNFPFIPTSQQEEALEKLTGFFFSQDKESLFVLKGYAGTGKSSLVGTVVKTMNNLGQKAVLMAPTGRAAKVFSSYAGQSAYTIHKKIYRQKKFTGEPSRFVPADNLYKNTFFIVDEASMISNDGLNSLSFGSDRLLDDLIHYVYSAENCRLILLGDTAQLPPVSQIESPALNKEILESYGMTVFEYSLTQVVRQTDISGILFNATLLRTAIEENNVSKFPSLSLKNYPDIQCIHGNELIEEISTAYDRDGLEESIVICRSNKRANIYNNGIRNRILFREDELSSGDLLMVVKNNYAVGEEYKEIDFIANGDVAEVRRVRNCRELYGFRFYEVSLHLSDYEIDIDMKILSDTLHSDSPALSKEMSEKLFRGVLDDYADLNTMNEKIKKIKTDPYYNALQVKYAYAMTCHKAQGGQWKNVFLDIGYISDDMMGMDFYRWLYTAFTRATKRLYLVNFEAYL